jgi:hypothetical protein
LTSALQPQWTHLGGSRDEHLALGEGEQGSHARADYNHLPDGPEQRARDEALRAADPLAANEWIYSHDPLAVKREE